MLLIRSVKLLYQIKNQVVHWQAIGAGHQQRQRSIEALKF